MFGAVAAYYGAGLILGNEVGGAAKFDEAMGVLVLVASVAGVVIGATAGGADSETGGWRDLVATGRSRSVLFAARVHAACAIVPAILAVAMLAAAALGDARLAIPQVGLTRLDGAEGLVASLPLAAAMAILLAWAAAGSGPACGAPARRRSEPA